MFALATDERSLLVFASSFDATDHCEGVDVEDGGWMFWDEHGDALAPQFVSPNRRGKFVVENGNFILAPAPDKPGLSLTVARIHHLEPNPFFADLEAVLRYLGSNSPRATDGT